MRVPALVCSLLALGCSSPDNLVVGGVLGDGMVPNATIATVGSAVSGLGTVTDVDGNSSPRALVLLSDQADLCAALEANPQLLGAPTSEFVVLALAVPAGMLGTFYPGSSNTEAGLFASAAPASNVYAYPGVSGTVALTEFDSLAQGTFDIEFADSTSTEVEVYGQFKAGRCDAIATAYIPEVVLGE